MLGFIVFVLAHFLVSPPHSYEDWRGWIASPGIGVASFLFVAALLTHAWVGLRDVTLDYVASLAARIAALSLIAVSLLAAGAWTVRLLWLGHG